MAVASAALIFPTALYSTLRSLVGNKDAERRILALSHGAAIILVILYFVYLFFQLKTPANFFDMDPIDEEELERDSAEPAHAMPINIALLIVTILGVSICASYLTPTVEHVAKALWTSKSFVKFVFLPLATNAGSLGMAAVAGFRGRAGFAIYGVFQNVMQITLLIIPAMVVFGWSVGEGMTLEFRLLEATVFFISVLVVNHLVQTGKGSYLGGIMCIAT
jgi:Ca2+:H+ antiporter